MVKFINSWVWTGENSKKYYVNDTGEFSKEIESMLVKEKIAVEETKSKKTDGTKEV